MEKKKESKDGNFSFCLSLPPFSQYAPIVSPATAPQKLPNTTPLSPPLHPSDPVSTPSLKQITP